MARACAPARGGQALRLRAGMRRARARAREWLGACTRGFARWRSTAASVTASCQAALEARRVQLVRGRDEARPASLLRVQQSLKHVKRVPVRVQLKSPPCRVLRAQKARG